MDDRSLCRTTGSNMQRRMLHLLGTISRSNYYQNTSQPTFARIGRPIEPSTGNKRTNGAQNYGNAIELETESLQNNKEDGFGGQAGEAGLLFGDSGHQGDAKRRLHTTFTACRIPPVSRTSTDGDRALLKSGMQEVTREVVRGAAQLQVQIWRILANADGVLRAQAAQEVAEGEAN